MKSPAIFIGVDQTGAALPGGLRAQPLPCAILVDRGRSWELKLLWLPSLTRAALEQAFIETLDDTVGGLKLDSSVTILADCVLGLETHVFRALTGAARNQADALWGLMKETLKRQEPPFFGRAIAEEFFAELLKRSGHAGPGLPRRQCELAARANSVFASRPFQKNIQTGTYRMWRDLASDGTRWFSLWPFESARDSRPVMLEAFPSLAWREALGLKTRDRTKFREAVQTAVALARVRLKFDDWSKLERDADLADAATLALAGAIWARNGKLADAPKKLVRGEGWIAGL